MLILFVFCVILIKGEIMKIEIYVNKAKDKNHIWLEKLTSVADKLNIEYKIICDDDLNSKSNADALFVLGGDGTILNLTEYAGKNNLPLVGINAGKLGFLTEFEMDEIEDAFNLFKNNQLEKDSRVTLKIKVNDKIYYALNDAVVQRIRVEERGNNVASIDVYIDNNLVDKIIGDGVVVSTPTGTTAYALSAGGAILAPGIEAFSITAIAGHSFNQRPIVYSSKSICELQTKGLCKTGLFVDGIFACEIEPNDKLEITREDFTVTFLRKQGFNFYKRLSLKLKDRNGI